MHIETNRAVIYCRISSDPTGKAAGVKRQEDDCRELATKLGLEVAAVFVDNDVSAYAETRPHWEEMLRLIESDGIDTLIVWHTDRLYRRPRDLERLLDLLDDGALPGMVRTVTAGDLDLSTPAGRAMARTLVAWSKNAEVEQMRLRMTRAKRQKAVDGLPGGGRRPFGYEPDKITVRKAEAKLIRDAVARITAGESLRSIADDWNKRKIPTRDGGPWRQQTIRNIVANPRMAGLRTYKGEIIGEAAWPPIITVDEHKRMVAASKTRRGNGADAIRTDAGTGCPVSFTVDDADSACGHPRWHPIPSTGVPASPSTRTPVAESSSPPPTSKATLPVCSTTGSMHRTFPT